MRWGLEKGLKSKGQDRVEGAESPGGGVGEPEGEKEGGGGGGGGKEGRETEGWPSSESPGALAVY